MSGCIHPCNVYVQPGYAPQTYSQAYSQTPYNQTYNQSSYNPTYAQPYGYQAQYQTAPANYPVVYGSQPSPNAYGTHAYGPLAYGTNSAGPYPQLRGYSDPYDLRAYKYGNLGVILYDFDSEKFGLQGRVGYQSAGIFGAELEGSVSLGSETDELDADETAIVRGFTDLTLTPGTSTLTKEFTNSVAAFAVARLPLSDRFSIHSRAGLHATRFKSELDDGTQVLRQSDTSVDIAYGLGMNYSFTPKNDIRLDYTVYENDLGGNADSLSVALAHKF
ncbi:outer membrane beta-barrel protein [Hellea sp.]|nr:outer membrane beta-barrel protein [Hellea sp.]